MEQAKDPEVRRILGAPYALYPDGVEAGLDGGDQMNVRWDENEKLWTMPFVMAGINTRVVRRSNAMMDFPYGKNFRYRFLNLILL